MCMCKQTDLACIFYVQHTQTPKTLTYKDVHTDAHTYTDACPNTYAPLYALGQTALAR